MLEYSYRVSRAGTYETGLATMQCAYAPEYASHSASMTIILNSSGRGFLFSPTSEAFLTDEEGVPHRGRHPSSVRNFFLINRGLQGLLLSKVFSQSVLICVIFGEKLI